MLAATAPLAGVEEVIGLADIALVDTGVAELGIVVDDEHQGSGVGTALIEAWRRSRPPTGPRTCARSCSTTTAR